MSIFSDSFLIATAVTLPDILQELGNTLISAQEEIARNVLKEHERGKQEEKRAWIQLIRDYKVKAVSCFDEIIKAADRVSGSVSELNSGDLVNLIYESVLFDSFCKQISTQSRRAEQFDLALEFAGIHGLGSELGGQAIFSQEAENRLIYQDCFDKPVNMLIQAALTGDRMNTLSGFSENLAYSMSALEYVLRMDDSAAIWPGNSIALDFLSMMLTRLTEKGDTIWHDMSPQDKQDADPERWKSESIIKSSDGILASESILKAEGTMNMDQLDNPREVIKAKLRENFDGRIVRKDLTKKIKEGANVPVYVLEFLLGQYCSSDDPAIIEEGVDNVKRILADNFVRPDEAQKILSLLRSRGSYTVIDKITVGLNIRNDTYEAEFSNLGLKNIPISETYPEKYDRLLCGGIWCIVQLEYEYIEEAKRALPIEIRKLTPIQMPHVDINELKQGRKAFTKEEWMDVILRSIGMEPDMLNQREKWLLLARVLPLVENNYNLCELGPRSTGKSHLFKEISPNSILVSGGQTTVANLFYNMAKKTVGLVGLWDCVAFDEVAGINFKDKDGIQIMKDYMASGSFARGKEEKAASASMVFVGNINQSVDVLLKTSSLFDPFPPEMGTDTAFLDRMHSYIPGWEIPKFRPEHFTDDYGFITDYLAEFLRELRKEQYGDALDKYFRLGKNLNQRDTIAVRKTVGGFIKLLYPDGEFTKDQLEEILRLALELRRRVKEQLKKLGGMEFYDVNFSYIDNETFEERFVSVPEQGGGKLIPEGMCNPGQLYTVGRGSSGMLGVFRLEAQMLPGNGRFDRTGLGTGRDAKEATNTAFNYLKANSNRISGSISTTTKNYIIDYQDLQGIGMTDSLALPTLISLCSIALSKPALSSMAVLGDISIAGTLIKMDELANALQVCLDSGAKKVLLPISSAIDLGSVPADLIGCFNLIFFNSPEDAVFKALGVE